MPPGRIVAYSLGNFVHDEYWSEETMEGLVIEATFHGDELAQVRVRPVLIVDDQADGRPSEKQSERDAIGCSGSSDREGRTQAFLRQVISPLRQIAGADYLLEPDLNVGLG